MGIPYHWRELPQVLFSSWQKYACHDKIICATDTCLWRQKWYLWQLPPMITEHISQLGMLCLERQPRKLLLLFCWFVVVMRVVNQFKSSQEILLFLQRKMWVPHIKNEDSVPSMKRNQFLPLALSQLTTGCLIKKEDKPAGNLRVPAGGQDLTRHRRKVFIAECSQCCYPSGLHRILQQTQQA